MRQKDTNTTASLLTQYDDKLELIPNFVDEDLILIDNIKLLGVPDAVYTNMNLLVLCKKGKAQLSVNRESYEISTDDIFICPPEMTLESVLVSPDFEYQALCITNRLLQIVLHDYINVWNQLVYVQKIRVLKVEEDNYGIREKSTLLLKAWTEHEVKDEVEAKYRAEIIKGLIYAILIGFCFTLHRQKGETVETKQNVSLFNRFLELLQTTEAKHQTVDYYASQLCISAKYLTIISKKNSGKTANEWIQEYKLSAITNYLLRTDGSIKEISNLLGFPNTSFFGKYVKDHLGCSPLEYRKRQRSKLSSLWVDK